MTVDNAKKVYVIRGSIGVGLFGAEREFEFDIDADEWDDMTPAEQEEAAKEMAFSYINWDYSVEEAAK